MPHHPLLPALAFVGCALLLAPNFAHALEAPYSQDFNGYATGNTITEFTETSAANTTIVQESAGDNGYQFVVNSNNASAGAIFSNLLNTDAVLTTEMRFPALNLGGTINAGFGVLGGEADFSATTSTQYRILFFVTTGLVSIQEKSTAAGAVATLATSTGPLAINTTDTYTMRLELDYVPSGLQLSVVVSSSATGNPSTSVSFLDTTPRSGTFYGYRTAVSGGATVTAVYDNLTIVPEPTSTALLLGSVALLGLARRRRA